MLCIIEYLIGRLTEEMVYQQGNNREVAQLLYTLLGPLLTLRSLTDEAFGHSGRVEVREKSDEPSQRELFRLLMDAALSPLQFDDIRKLSCELTTRFPLDISFPCYLERFTSSLLAIDDTEVFVQRVSELDEDKKEMDLVVAKTFVLFFCGALVRHGLQIEKYMVHFVKYLLHVFEWPEFSPDVATGEKNLLKSHIVGQDLSTTQKIQRGCLDFFSLAVIFYFEYEKATIKSVKNTIQTHPLTTICNVEKSCTQFLEIGKTKRSSSLLITPLEGKEEPTLLTTTGKQFSYSENFLFNNLTSIKGYKKNHLSLLSLYLVLNFCLEEIGKQNLLRLLLM